MYVKLNTKFRRVVGLSSNELFPTSDTKVFNKSDITTTDIQYIKITGIGENIDVSEMTTEEKAAVDANNTARREALFARSKNKQIEKLNNIFQQVTDKIGLYPQNEMASWNTQLTEAKAYQADNTAATPFIDLIADERTDLGSTVAEKRAALVTRILNNDQTWTALVGKLIGLRHKKELDITNATSVMDFEDISKIRSDFYTLYNQIKTNLNV